MPTITGGMAYGAGSSGSPYNAYSQVKMEELMASKGGKLLAPDEFYKHPARQIFGSYSTYVDWYAGGKKRRADEAKLYNQARGGNWTPTDYGPITPGTGAQIKAGGKPTVRTDITGNRTEGVLAGVTPRLGESAPRLTQKETLALNAERAPLAQAAQDEYNRRVSAATMSALPPEEQAKIEVENKRLAQRRVALAEKEEERRVADVERKSKEFEKTWINRFAMRDKIHENAKELLGIKNEYDISKAMIRASEAAKTYAANLKISKTYADAEYARALADKRADVAKAASEKDKAQIKGEMIELAKMRYNHDLKQVAKMREFGDKKGAAAVMQDAEDTYRSAIESVASTAVAAATPESAPVVATVAPVSAPPEIKEGTIVKNPQTGQRLIYRNGAWENIQ